ncbi:SubName: Full=Uncharacterized protein {ECO:0000313/EMBL:CCA71444.1} [Serendipita indica DSM 11827]|uniref:Uncharacterized protein n=1 Tax=Serendipita indica (strain DSM 11827) TaxID=1109443 RepID=G4TJE6_SERID|nr:SubName: Full=Uncharacterized protein {ECO:0000313/EMBL:CCA71444.1} [Serendipita indica DSM 11827]CCA71444.1 hypothetical protein PIIN_05383 [Serendipita indica DSM 11827]
MAVESHESAAVSAFEEVSYENHPILRVPDDILCLIFEQLCPGSSHHRNKLAYDLGCVNKRWRDVSRRTPNIWRCLDIDISYSVSVLAAQYRYITSVRPDPDNIRIYRSRGDDFAWNHLREIFRECRISQLKVIEHLSIYIYKPYLANTLLENLPFLEGPRIRELYLSTQSKREESDQRAPWDAARSAILIPGAEKLYLSHQFDVQFFSSHSPPVSSITFLDVYDCKDVQFLPGLAMFTNLKKLRVRWVECPSPPAASDRSMINLPSLELLHIARSPNFPWDHLSCPSLRRILGDEDVSLPMIRFLGRHPEILELDVCVDPILFEPFNLSCPQLEVLDLRGHLEGLVGWHKNDLSEWDKNDLGGGTMLFPKLKKLILDRVDEELSIELLDAILAAWFYPQSPTSERTPIHYRDRPIECLGILGETKDLLSPSWMKSRLLKGCEQKSTYLPHLGEHWTCVEFRWSIH